MVDPFASALVPLTVHLDEVHHCVSFLRDSSRLKSILGKLVKWELGDTSETRFAQSFIKSELVQSRPVLNGLLVTVVAAFEEFLRTVIVSAARMRVTKSRKFQDLGESFINRHIEYSGRLLATVHSPPAHISVNYFDICRRLGTCIPDSTAIEINDTALGFIRSVTDIDTFLDCIKGIGYKISLDDMGRDRNLQGFLKTSGTRETSKELKRALNDVVLNRHKIAHSGQSYAEITEDILFEHMKVLELTATAIIHHLTKQLKDNP